MQSRVPLGPGEFHVVVLVFIKITEPAGPAVFREDLGPVYKEGLARVTLTSWLTLAGGQKTDI